MAQHRKSSTVNGSVMGSQLDERIQMVLGMDHTWPYHMAAMAQKNGCQTKPWPPRYIVFICVFIGATGYLSQVSHLNHCTKIEIMITYAHPTIEIPYAHVWNIYRPFAQKSPKNHPNVVEKIPAWSIWEWSPSQFVGWITHFCSLFSPSSLAVSTVGRVSESAGLSQLGQPKQLWRSGGWGEMGCQWFGFTLVGGLEHECYMTFDSVGNVILPTDEILFFRGVGIPPTR